MSEMQWIPRSSHSITAFCQRADGGADRWSRHYTSNLTAHLFFLFAYSKFTFATHTGKKLMSFNWSSLTQLKGNRSAELRILFSRRMIHGSTQISSEPQSIYVILRTGKLMWPEQYVKINFLQNDCTSGLKDFKVVQIESKDTTKWASIRILSQETLNWTGNITLS